MKAFSLILLSALFSTHVFAAKFKTIPNVSSTAAQKLSSAAAGIVGQQEIFGDSSTVLALSFERKLTEADAQTIKQLSFMKAGANSDDGHDELTSANLKDIVSYALYAIENQESEYPTEFTKAQQDLTEALKYIKADRKLKIFGSSHADEDGSWQVLYILDTVKKEVLLVKIGFWGT